MNQYVVHVVGGPEVIHREEVPTPKPAPGEVRVRVRAVALAYGDLMRRRGFVPVPTPFVLGHDCVGTVDAVGEGVETPRVGDPVIGIPLMGAYGDFVCFPAYKTVVLPPACRDLDPAALAALPIGYVAAYKMLHRVAGVRAGERILVHAAAGGVGTAMLDLGRVAGLEMVGTASPAKMEVVADLGATAIDYRFADFAYQARRVAPEGFDAVFDPVGGFEHWEQSWSLLRPGGRLVCYGFIGPSEGGDAGGAARAFTDAHESVAKLAARDPAREVLWSQMDANNRFDEIAEDLGALLGLLADGKIAPLIAERIPMAQVAGAHARFERGDVVGKIVLVNE